MAEEEQQGPRLREIWADAEQQLQAAGVDQPRLDARLLIEHATGLDRTEIMMRPSLRLTEQQATEIAALVARRAAREPVGRITGQRGFWTLELGLSPDTLEPRPDTETLVDAVLGRVDHAAESLRILDLGTGSGAILLALLADLPTATGLGTDISEGALATARANAAANGLEARATFRQASWADGLAERFDIIVSNPPYIPSADIETLEPEVKNHDPRRALDGGADGLEAYRAIASRLADIAAPHALVALECGIGQAEDVAALIHAQGAQDIEILRDFGGVERVIVARMPQ